MTRALFLDRDGVVIEEKHYLHRPEDVVILPRVGPSLRQAAKAGFGLFMVTNQSGVGRGYYTLEDVERVHRHLVDLLAKEGVELTRIYVAPEAPDQPSRGRKPSPQFLLDAQQEYKLDLAASYLVGDKLSDLECGWNAGVKKCFLVRTGYGAQTEREEGAKLGRAVVVEDLPAAVDCILAQPSN